MSIQWRETRVEWTVRGDCGYEFTVIAERDPEDDWRGSVAFVSHGYQTSYGAVMALRRSVEAFLATLPELPGTSVKERP